MSSVFLTKPYLPFTTIVSIFFTCYLIQTTILCSSLWLSIFFMFHFLFFYLSRLTKWPVPTLTIVAGFLLVIWLIRPGSCGSSTLLNLRQELVHFRWESYCPCYKEIHEEDRRVSVQTEVWSVRTSVSDKRLPGTPQARNRTDSSGSQSLSGHSH